MNPSGNGSASGGASDRSSSNSIPSGNGFASGYASNHRSSRL
jgi:hypothetical protein